MRGVAGGEAARALLYQRFDTSPVAPTDRFEYWRERVAPLRLEPADGTRLRDFRASAEVLQAGDVGVIELTRGPAAATWSRDVGEMQGRLRLVVLAPSAGAAVRCYGADIPFTRGTAVLLGPTDGSWYAPAGMRGIEVDVPRDAFPMSDRQLAVINAGQVLQHSAVFTSLVRPALTGMAGQLHSLAGADAPSLATSWISMVTLLVASIAGAGACEADLVAARRVQARRFIAANLSDPGLDPDAVAAALRISRRSLYSALSDDGLGVAAQIRRSRLEVARAMLADPAQNRSIAEIAARVGLRSPTHFSRIFRAEYGHSPREARAEAGRE